MDRDTYFTRLSELRRQRRIISPTAEQLAYYFPHLNQDDIQRILAHDNEMPFWFIFSTPTLLVRDTYRSVHLARERSDDYGKEKPMELSLGNVYHLGDTANFLEPFSEKSVTYAQQNWNDALVSHAWQDVIKLELVKPGSSKWETVMTLSVATDRSWNELLSDRCKPRGSLVNESIVCIAHRELLTEELMCGHQLMDTLERCAECGGAHFSSDTCGSSLFSDINYNRWTHWVDFALPERVEEYAVAYGHEFKTDPARARRSENAWWKKRKKLGLYISHYRQFDKHGRPF